MKPKTLSARVEQARRELAECTEWLERISADVRAIEQRTIPEIVSAAEAAAILGINVHAFQMRVQRDLIPDPVAVLQAGRIWLRSDIEAMVADTAA